MPRPSACSCGGRRWRSAASIVVPLPRPRPLCGHVGEPTRRGAPRRKREAARERRPGRPRHSRTSLEPAAPMRAVSLRLRPGMFPLARARRRKVRKRSHDPALRGSAHRSTAAMASRSDGRQRYVSTPGQAPQQRQPARLVLGDLARLGLQLGEDDAWWTDHGEVRPAALRPLRQHRVVGVPAVQLGEVQDLALEVLLGEAHRLGWVEMPAEDAVVRVGAGAALVMRPPAPPSQPLPLPRGVPARQRQAGPQRGPVVVVDLDVDDADTGVGDVEDDVALDDVLGSGLGRMCTPHWRQYTNALRKAAVARKVETARRRNRSQRWWRSGRGSRAGRASTAPRRRGAGQAEPEEEPTPRSYHLATRQAPGASPGPASVRSGQGRHRSSQRRPRWPCGVPRANVTSAS